MVRPLVVLLIALALIAPADPAPSSVWAPLGRVPVRYEPGFQYLGFWNAATRTITLRAGMDPTTRAYVLHHEACHAALFDLGVVELDEAEEDAVCDAWGHARVREMQDGL